MMAAAICAASASVNVAGVREGAVAVVVNSVTVRAIKPHLMPRSEFAVLAEGRGGPELIDLLWNAERSRRLLMIKSLLDHATDNPALLGQLPGPDSVWTILARAQRIRSAEVDQVILHPQVGTALSYALRRCQGAAGVDGAPPWVDVGQLHVVGLMAAARAGVRWRTEVPLREATVMLPGLGLARFASASRWDQARAGTDGGTIWLEHGGHRVTVAGHGMDGDDDGGAPGGVALDADALDADARAERSDGAGDFLGLRRLAVGVAPALEVWLDDLDPFRDFADPVPPDPLDETSARRWQDQLAHAWRIICDDQPELAAALAAGVRSIVPLPDAEGWDNRSASTGEAFGSVMLSTPSDPTALAVSLVHEFQHIKLGGLMHLLTLTAEDEAATLYAPWRDDPRPLGGLAQGAYAFLGIATFWRAHRKNQSGAIAQLATFEYAYAREQTREALDILRSSRALTPLGRDFLDRMHDHVVSWLDDEIPTEVMDLVELVTAAHRAGWRIRHQRPRPADVSTLTRAWLETRAGLAARPAPRPADSAVRAHHDRNWSRGRLGLVRRRILAPGPLDDVLRVAPWATGLTGADVALVIGDVAAARAGYLAIIRADPSHVDAWTGLGLALRSAGAVEASTALLDRPELVVALHAALSRAGRPAAPVELASWLGSVLRTD